MDFQLESKFKPAGDQPEAIRQLIAGLKEKEEFQTLLGVTGSGKTFTIANVIQEVQRPTLVLSHNKTLVAQLYGEFKQFFPNNAVEYFVSYYDYYQPEAYVAVTDTYIEKDLSINEEVEKLRLRTTSSLLSGRRDVIVVASVSCIYGLGNPAEFKNRIIRLSKGMQVSRNTFLFQLVDNLYSRTTGEFVRGNFRVQGDVVDIYLPYTDHAARISFWGDEIEELEIFNPQTGKRIEAMDDLAIFPADIYVAPKDMLHTILEEIQDELKLQVEYYKDTGKIIEAKRLEERVNFDIEMMRELGYCSGIENYSRFFDRRNAGERPFCLLDYFPDDFLMIIDESHVTIPQVDGMHGGDRARKQSLVEFGFRLASAMDNRPLNFGEFEQLIDQGIFLSATPGDYELAKTEGVFIEQVVRPTGLLDPPIEVRPTKHQMDDLLEEIQKRIEVDERVLVTTLTKRMAEELTKYLMRLEVSCRYIHSEVHTLDRVEIIKSLRLGEIDVLVGVNLLREGLDLPEVSLVAILDADKEGFLRNVRSLTQTSGRAARNQSGLVIMYADSITKSMRRTIEETDRRREKQVRYNEEHGIVPKTIFKSKEEIINRASILDNKIEKEKREKRNKEREFIDSVAEHDVDFLNKKDLQKLIDRTKKAMLKAAKDTDFMEAARLRDEMYALDKKFRDNFG